LINRSIVCGIQAGCMISQTAMITHSTWWEYASLSAVQCSIQSHVSSAGDYSTTRKQKWNPVRKSRSHSNPYQH